MRFLKDKFYTGLFTLLLGPFGFIGGFVVWSELYWKVLNINFGLSFEYAGLTTAIIWGGIFIIRLKYFRQIPDGMTRDEFVVLQEIEKNVKKVRLHLSPFWVTILGICIAFVVLAVVFKESVTLVLIPGLVIFSVFGIIWRNARDRWKKMSSTERSQMNNDIVRFTAEVEAKDKHK